MYSQSLLFGYQEGDICGCQGGGSGGGSGGSIDGGDGSNDSDGLRTVGRHNHGLDEIMNVAIFVPL